MSRHALRKACKALEPERLETVTIHHGGHTFISHQLNEEMLQSLKAKFGPEHPSTLARMSTLARAYRKAGQLDKAQPLFEETLKLRNARLGPEHPETLASVSNDAVGETGKSRMTLPVSVTFP